MLVQRHASNPPSSIRAASAPRAADPDQSGDFDDTFDGLVGVQAQHPGRRLANTGGVGGGVDVADHLRSACQSVIIGPDAGKPVYAGQTWWAPGGSNPEPAD
jgi:hypothetical protein